MKTEFPTAGIEPTMSSLARGRRFDSRGRKFFFRFNYSYTPQLLVCWYHPVCKQRDPGKPQVVVIDEDFNRQQIGIAAVVYKAREISVVFRIDTEHIDVLKKHDKHKTRTLEFDLRFLS